MDNIAASLQEWMKGFGRDGSVEIEMQLKNVSKTTFKHLMSKLKRTGGWEAVQATETLDRFFPSFLRTSCNMSTGEETHTVKTRLKDPLDLTLGSVGVRFHAKKEKILKSSDPLVLRHAASRHLSSRHKQRVSFRTATGFVYDLTRVKNERGRVTYEVELEWAGQNTALDLEAATQSFIRQTENLVALVQWYTSH